MWAVLTAHSPEILFQVFVSVSSTHNSNNHFLSTCIIFQQCYVYIQMSQDVGSLTSNPMSDTQDKQKYYFMQQTISSTAEEVGNSH